jgi:hypothetical protein
MAYKFFAYKTEAQPIRTLADFRQHCSKPDYICTKRYTFLNQQLVDRNKKPLTDETFDPRMSLEQIFVSPELDQLTQDAQFMKAWDDYEYNHQDDRVAKWENFAG